MTPSPWPQRRKGTLCRVNGGFVPHERRTKQWGPAFSFKSRDAFVLKDKNYLRAAPGLLRGEGASAPSFPVSGRLDPGTSRSLGHQHPWKDLEAGGLQLGPNVTGPLLPPENSLPNSEFPEKMPERDGPPHTSGNPAADQPSQRRHVLSEEWQALQLPSRKEVTDTWSPTPGHPYPVTDTWSPTPSHRHPVAETSRCCLSIRATHTPSPELHTDEPVLGAGGAYPRVSGAAGHYYLCPSSAHYSEQ